MSAALFIVDYSDFSQWEHEAILDGLKQLLARQPDIIKLRKAIIEHVFGTIKEVWGYGV
jgi:hypothetical protein